jgi:heme/copper-type cytochrome/quinol oxidase subunit 2
MTRKITVLIGVFLLLFVLNGCTQANTPEVTTTDTTQPSTEDVTTSMPVPAPGVDPDSVEEMVVEDNNQPGDIKEFAMTARQFEFEPSTITVNEGDTVRLTITSEDVPHGFAIAEFDVNARLPVNEPTTVEFVADKAGTYRFFCSVMCGEGHREMTGTLVVN